MRSIYRARGDRKKGFRLRHLLLAVLTVAVALTATYWSWIDAQARAVIVLSSLLQTPVLTPAVDHLTGEPRFEDGSIAGYPALIVRPDAGQGPWPTLFFVNGAVPEGRELPEVRRLAEGLARAGYMVVVPDLPGLKSGEITPETVSGTIEVAQAVSKQPDTRDGQVGLVGVSTGAALALLAAEDPSLKGHVSAVSGVAPYSDIRTILNIATTGYYRDGQTLVPYKADPYLSYVVARSGVAMLSAGKDQQKLESELNEVGRLDPDPLADLRNRSLEDLGPEARSMVALLANEDPERFDELYEALPDEIRAKLDRISPLSGEGQIEAPVELVSGPRDKYFPISESYAVARIAPNLRVTVTGALDHAELSFSLGDIPGFVRMDGFVVQSIRQTRSASSPD